MARPCSPSVQEQWSSGHKIREQYADTGGFTDHVFAVTALLGFQFIPRIRDLPSKRLYVFEPGCVPKELKGLIGGKVREGTITRNWPDILRCAATMVAGVMPPSQLLRKFAAYPRQHELAEALKDDDSEVVVFDGKNRKERRAAQARYRRSQRRLKSSGPEK